MTETLSHRIRLGLVLCLLLWAVSFGISFGAGNQNSYLIHGLQRANPDFLSRDWLTSQTTDYQPVFSFLVFLFAKAGSVEWGCVVLNLALITIGGLFIYGMILSLVDCKIAFPALLLVLSLSSLDQTRSVADSYIFSDSLQPSTIGGFCLLVAMWFFLKKRYFISGLVLGIGGAFHVNYLVLGFPLFALAHLLMGTKRIGLRLIQQLAPSGVILCFFLPLLLGASASKNAAAGQMIFLTIRSPRHYVPLTFARDFMPYLGWIILGTVAIFLVSRFQKVERGLVTLFASSASLVMCASLLTTIHYIPGVAQLYVWRLAPYAVLLAQIVVSVEVVYWLVGKQLSLDRTDSIASALTVVGLAPIFLFYHRSPITYLISFVCLAVFSVWVVRRGWLSESAIVARIMTVLPLLVFLAATFSQGSRVVARSNVIVGLPGDEVELYRWARHSPPEALFLVPPSLMNFRLNAGRAIVVDWKSMPVVTDELLEWYRRIGLVAGDMQVRDEVSVERGYATMDVVRLQSIVKEFGVMFVVFKKAEYKGAASNYRQAFSNKGFVVFDVSDKKEASVIRGFRFIEFVKAEPLRLQ